MLCPKKDGLYITSALPDPNGSGVQRRAFRNLLALDESFNVDIDTPQAFAACCVELLTDYESLRKACDKWSASRYTALVP